MATTPTTNPVPSESPRDLKFNAGKIDEFVTSQANSYVDRLGGVRLTRSGIENLVRQTVGDLGWAPLADVSFEVGATLTDATQALKYEADGNYYRWDGDFDRAVPAGSTPESTGGVAQGAWVNVTDLTLRTALASVTGDDLIGTTGGITQSQRNDVVRDIRDFGGVDNWNGATGTNCHAAILAVIAEGLPAKLYLPLTNTGVYYVEGTTALANVDGLEYILDPGVSVYTASDSINNVIRKPGSKANRDFKIEVGGASRFTHRLGSEMFDYPSDKSLVDATTAGDIYIPEKLTFTSDFTPQYCSLSAWPAGAMSFSSNAATFGITITDTTTNAINFTVPTASFIGVMFATVPGDFLQASVRNGGNFPAIAVEIDGGWIIVRQGSATTIAVNERWSTSYQVEANYPVKNLDIAPYKFGNASTGVIVFDSQSFGIVVNGVVVCRHNTVRPIVSVGWACGYQDSSSAGGVCTIQYPTRIRGKRQFGIPPVRLVTIGDSTGDRDVTIQSQFEFAAQYLAGVGGSQVTDLLNLSVRGETAAQQSTRLLATDISGYDFCLIQVGINDIQTQSGYAAFASTILGMVDYCKTHSVVPIVGIPAMFYTRADITTTGITTDHIGQNSGNSHRGTLYRLNLMQTLGTAGVMMNIMSHDAYGLVTPRLLSPGRSLVDPIMMDNIHQTVFGSMLMGMSWARAIAAYFTKSGRDGLLKSATVGAGKTGYLHLPARYFTNGGTASTPYYTVSQDGKSVTLSYYLSRDSNTWVANQTLGVLPERLRPVTDQAFATQPCAFDLVPISGAIAMVQILKDGTVKVMGAPSATVATVFLPFSITYAI
ncbi:hypothetical protein Pcaca05_05040 [Pectobacterium carotovorum subsp. carotovorum]|nr:hypothetical protein Pcaca05_05040 [Pectobacterium carotovorum subsp. carotovorum]